MRIFDGMTLDFILDEVQRIEKQVEYTEDTIGMRYGLAVTVYPSEPLYCKIHLGEFVLWDSGEDDCRAEESLVECIQRRIGQHVLTASRIGEACEMLTIAKEK